LLRQLKKEFRPHLVCPSDGADDAGCAQALRAEGVDVTLVPHRPSPLLPLNAILPGRPPVTIAKYASRLLAQTLEQSARPGEYAAVHCDHLHMAQYRPCAPTLPWVLDEHNVEHLILERLAAVQSNPIKRLVVADQARRVRRFEHEAVRGASRVLAVSANDVDALRRLGSSTPIEVVPNGVDTAQFEPSPADPASSDLVFTGSMDWWPNEDAARFFVQGVLPRIQRERAGVRLFIVGRAPTPAVRRLAESNPAVTVTGEVPDIRPYLRRAAVVVVPIRVGGGTRLKILEAMGAGRAVVSTTLGAEGIDCVPGEHISIADTPEALATAILTLLADPSRAARLAQSARRLVTDRYDWHSIGQRLLSVYESMGLFARSQATAI